MKKILLLSILLCSCSNNNISIRLEDIFLQKEESYFVMFYLDSCTACRNAKLKINELHKRFNIICYFIDLFEYSFSLESQNNIGVCNYQNINVIRVPTLLKIEKRIINEEYIGYERFNMWVDLIKK